ncbi:gamma-glutamyltranspeptidase family protein [Asticcacaulis biprosthecium C19]|uniref:Gamma-glutamyltranspeptidase family protein n=1 Tax=Asticcacaulis biprosthecium C19 TaxID=715226 RepID=F4QN31_9CAUL|nr:gamma-glutamyltransferase [Asticcacaulis biprosthecium]EGF91622.1 gamma-glutamyltranspeptidase family protein [Asticcacaulis biprosthecium C19]
MIHTPSSYRGMVTSPHHLASQAGLDILKAGGTAREAAVAVAATLAVVYPHMNSIGGDSFWLIREPDGRVHSVHGCGGAAQKATLDLYRGHDAVPWRGSLAANTVAGTISAWQAMLEGGTLTLARILEAAIHYAECGVAVTQGGAEIAAVKDAELKDVFGYSDVFGGPVQAGDQLKQPALAQTLKRLTEQGLSSFYTGALAREIAADLALAGSPVFLADLEAHRVEYPQPLYTGIPGATLYNAAPPTQGFASLLILAMFSRLGVTSVDDFPHLHGLVEATKRAFLLRDAHIGDPAFMNFDPQALLSDPAALDALAAKINPAKALPWPHDPAKGDTVWFGVIDGEGRAVSAIQSTYFEFGSGLVLPQTGIIWQNRGASFTLTETGPRALKPGRKPFHTLNPAMAVFDDGRVMPYGTMGGEGQPQTQAAIFSRYAAGVPLQQSVTAPRWLLGKTWGENSVTLKLEDRFDPAVYAALRQAGHDVELVPPFTSMMGHAGALVRHGDGRIDGATDPRSDGSVASW